MKRTPSKKVSPTCTEELVSVYSPWYENTGGTGRDSLGVPTPRRGEARSRRGEPDHPTRGRPRGPYQRGRPDSYESGPRERDGLRLCRRRRAAEPWGILPK